MDNFRMIFEKPKLAKNRAEKKESRPQDFFDNAYRVLRKGEILICDGSLSYM